MATTRTAPTRRRRTARALGVASALALGAGLALGSTNALALLNDVPENGTPGFLVLRSGPSQWQHLTGGDTLHWLVDAELGDADRGSLHLELIADGPLIDAADMTVAVDACDVPFTVTADLTEPGAAAPTCPGGATTVVTTSPLDEVAAATRTARIDLATIHRGIPRHLHLTLALHPDAAVDQTHTARFGVGLHAAGDDIQPGRGGDGPSGNAPDGLPASDAPANDGPNATDALAGTGLGTDIAALALIAAGIACAGVALSFRRRPRTPETGRSTHA